MAAGTALSRVMGFFRLMLLVFLFGNGTRQAEMFTIANTVPNSMYILLAGGVLNTVLVPQIVRAIKNDSDRGEAYTNRIMTAGLIALGLITVLLTLAVPAIVRLYSAEGWKAPALDAQYASMVMLAYYCMPQVFFYGVHVLAGQVLNARDRFGPMMWAPIANNVVSIAVLLLFLAVFGHTPTGAPFTSGQQLLLGLGSTLGIAVQAVVLIPFLRAAGFHFRPRLDFRHTGLGKTFRLAKWTLGFVLITQAALVVVSKLATGATVGGRGAGLTSYYNAYAVWILPHSLITVSLATAMLPAASRLAAAHDHAGVAAETMRAIRLAVTALLPAAVAFLVLGLPLAHLVFGFGAGAEDASYVGSALMALAVGLVPFTVQYICLRAFYALEDTRSTFFLQCLISGSNVILGVTAVLILNDPGLVATGLAFAYSAAYLIGVLVSFARLRRHLPELNSDDLVRHCVRLLLAVIPGAIAAWLICWGFTSASTGKLVLAAALAVAGIVAVGLFLVMSRLMKITEVTAIISTVLRRRGAAPPTRRSGDTRDNDPCRTAATTPCRTATNLVAPGDLPTVIRPKSLTIEQTSAVAAVPTVPGGPAQNVEHMAQATFAPDLVPEGSNRGETLSGAPPNAERRAYAHIRPTTPDPADPDPSPAATASRPAATLPAGTVLASRYRLEELIAEAKPTITWRAFDQVLSRSVLLHLLTPGDPAESDLLAAARKASVATDSRFLRVLDAVQSTRDDLGSYIVCEYATGQSLEVILSHAPLSGLEAAWVVREVADALAGVHSLGLYHRRINPDTVIITPDGNVKIVGLLIESALRPARSGVVHGATTPELVDVTDLGRLLYAALVSRWPGGPAFSLPDAPVVGRRWMTPRQVRAGVSPALDGICDQLLGDPPRHRAASLTSAGAVVNALTKVLGSADASGDLERRLRQPIPTVGRSIEHVDPATGAPPVSSLLASPEANGESRRRPAAAVSAPPQGRVSATRTTPPTVRNSTGQTTVIRPLLAPGPKPSRPARQSQRWVGLLIVLAVLLIAAGMVSAMVLDRRIAAAPPATASSSPSASTSASAPPPKAGPLAIVAGRDFDPQGDDRTENPGEVKLAFDGDPKTRWRTVRYIGDPKLGNIKRGVGLVLDLGTAQPVRAAQLSLSGTGTSVELRVPAGDPAQTAKPPMDSDRSWRTVAAATKAGSKVTLTAQQSVTTRYVLVYLTSLPKEGEGYRGGIYEVAVLS